MHHGEAARSWHTKLGFGFRHCFSTLVFGGSSLGFFIGNLLLTCNLGGSFGWCVCVMILVSSCRYCSILICCLFSMCLQVILLSKVRFIDLRLMQATPAWCSWNMSGSANLKLAPHGCVDLKCAIKQTTVSLQKITLTTCVRHKGLHMTDVFVCSWLWFISIFHTYIY